MNIFHRYVIKEHVLPFLFAFSVIMFIMLLKFMLQLMGVLISKGVGLLVVAQLLVFNLAWMVALVVPMSVLVATLMAFGRMGASGEITAMKAAGLNMYRVISPIFLIGILFTIIMIWFNNEILPIANHRASSLKRAIAAKRPELSLKNREGQFISDIENLTIRVDDIDQETDIMTNVTLFKKEQNEYATTILADRGWFETYSSGDRIAMVLKNGEIHRAQREQGRYIRSSFDTFRQIIKIDFGLDTSRTAAKNDRTKTTAEMKRDIIESKKRIRDFEKKIREMPEKLVTREADIENYKMLMQSEKRRINSYLVEIHKKNSLPVAAIVFVLIGASMGMLVKRSGASIGIGLSIGFFALYYMFLIAGESAGDRMILAPWFSMWLPNFVFGITGIFLIVYANRR